MVFTAPFRVRPLLCVTCRDILIDLKKGERVLSLIRKRMNEKTVLLISSAVARRSSRVSSFLSGGIAKKAKEAEERIYLESRLSSWDERDLEGLVGRYLPNAEIAYLNLKEIRHIDDAIATSWWNKSYSKYLECDLKDEFISSLKNRDVPFCSTVALIKVLPEKKRPSLMVDKSEKEWHEVHEKTR